MKNCLLFLAVVGVMLVAAPAHSQYIYLDVTGDGKNSLNDADPTQCPSGAGCANDLLTSSVNHIDVYYVTDKNRDGSAAVCSSGPENFTINSYEFILRRTGTGSVTYGAWTDNMTGYTGGALCGDGTVCAGGDDVWVAKFKFTYDAPGKYKVGSLAVTVTGTPQLSFVTSTSLDPGAGTTFGSLCAGARGDNTIRYTIDFCCADGTSPGNTPVRPTTWGKIKELYH